MLSSLLTGACVLTLDSGVALANMIKSALSSSGTPSSALVLAATRMMGLVAAQLQHMSDEYTSSAISSYLSTFGGAVNSFLSAGLQQAVQRDPTLSSAIASLVASNEKLNMGLTCRVHLGNSSLPARLGVSTSAMLTSTTRLRSGDIGDGSGFVLPNPQDATASGSAGGLAAQNPADRLTLLPSAMQAAGTLASGPNGNGFVSAQVTLYDASLNALLPTSVSSAALSHMNSSSASIFSRVLSVSLDPPVSSSGSDLVEITFMFLSPLNESNQTVHCSYLDTCVYLMYSG